MSIKLQLPTLTDLRPRLTVIGVGGAGCNAVNNMIAAGLHGVEFVVANTDAQSLAASSAEHRIQLGTNLTEGLGAGSKPEIGEAAAEEAVDEIRAQVSGAHMVFIAAGMGGGTGTGAAPVIARVAKEAGVLTVGVVTRPFQFEGARRQRIADAGIAELRRNVDTLIVIPNQNLFRVANEKTTFAEAFVLADQVLYSGVACIVDLILKEGLINLDFADVRTVMSGMGTAMMGTGEASGERRAIVAAEEAIANPLLDDVTMKGAKGLLLSITGGRDMTLYEVDEAASRVRQEVDPDANIIVGATFDDSLGDRVRVSIVASGMSRPDAQLQAETAPPAESPWPRQKAEAAAATKGVPFPDPDLQRKLSTAMQPGPGGAPPPLPGEFGAAPAAPSEHPPRARETWRAPGNVTIEEGLPHLMGHAPRPPSPPRVDSYESSPAEFSPQPPQDVRRAGGRRMPEIEDFPALAQREYRAKAAPEPARGPSPAHADSRRWPGLLGRLAGFGRADGDSSVDAGDVNSRFSAPRYTDRAPNAPRETREGAEDGRSKSQDDLGIPVFFNRERK
jgi:cell division protein FtsZ